MVRGLVAPGLADSEINVVCRGPVNEDVRRLPHDAPTKA